MCGRVRSHIDVVNSRLEYLATPTLAIVGLRSKSDCVPGEISRFTYGEVSLIVEFMVPRNVHCQCLTFAGTNCITIV